MDKVYIIVNSEGMMFDPAHSNRADAEEMILAMVQAEVYEDFCYEIDYYETNIKDYPSYINALKSFGWKYIIIEFDIMN